MSANEGNSLWPRFLASLLAGILVVGLTACGGGGGGGGVIDPEDSNAMSRALAVKFGGVDAERKEGDPPASNPSDTENPTVSDVPGEEDVTPGETKEISFNADASPSSALAALYAKVTGSDDYFEAGVDQTQSLTKQTNAPITLSFDIPENLGAGEFCVDISVGDTESRTSESEQVCFNVRPEEFSPAAVQARLQGTWELCNGRFLETGTFQGGTLSFSETEYAETGCSGAVVDTFNDTLQYSIGPAFTADDGLFANEFDAEVTESDASEDVGLQFSGILRVTEQPDELFLNVGEENGSPSARPTGFAGQDPYLRPQSNGGGGGSSTPLEDQAWSFSVNGEVTQDGETQNVSFESPEPVNGLSVPQQQPDESDIVLSDSFSAGFQEACDQFDGEAQVEQLDFTRNGGGEVGTAVELIIDYFADGTCTQDGETQQINVDVRLTYNWTRLE
jgi:hypothetical protein